MVRNKTKQGIKVKSELEPHLSVNCIANPNNKRKMPLFGKKDSGKKVRKDGHKDIDKQIINIEDKYHLRQVLGKWVKCASKFSFIISLPLPHTPFWQTSSLIRLLILCNSFLMLEPSRTSFQTKLFASELILCFFRIYPLTQGRHNFFLWCLSCDIKEVMRNNVWVFSNFNRIFSFNAVINF